MRRILAVFHKLSRSVAPSHHTPIRITCKPYSQQVLKCWQCGSIRAATETLTCTNCNTLQKPPDTSNYFTVMNIEPNFDVDTKLLTNKYRQLQAVLHPDKYSNKSLEERDISANYSALVNSAFDTLRTPLKRAVHLLNLQGESIDEDQKVTDPELLALIMELNEEVEAAKTPEQLKSLDKKNHLQLETIIETLSSLFKAREFKKAKDEIIKMKYYNSIRMRINNLLRERGIVD